MNDRIIPHDRCDRSSEPDRQEPEAFAAVPEAFLSGPSPERFRAMQQLYETAFELARRKVARLDEDVERSVRRAA